MNSDDRYQVRVSATAGAMVWDTYRQCMVSSWEGPLNRTINKANEFARRLNN